VSGDHRKWLGRALEEASRSAEQGEVPVGAVLVKDGDAIATSGNDRERSSDPTGHAEIRVLRAGAAQLKSWRLEDCTLYVTLEPCPMCLAAAQQARIKRIIFGAVDAKGGGHQPGASIE